MAEDSVVEPVISDSNRDEFEIAGSLVAGSET
jgi:hypothetical protein